MHIVDCPSFCTRKTYIVTPLRIPISQYPNEKRSTVKMILVSRRQLPPLKVYSDLCIQTHATNPNPYLMKRYVFCMNLKQLCILTNLTQYAVFAISKTHKRNIDPYPNNCQHMKTLFQKDPTRFDFRKYKRLANCHIIYKLTCNIKYCFGRQPRAHYQFVFLSIKLESHSIQTLKIKWLKRFRNVNGTLILL